MWPCFQWKGSGGIYTVYTRKPAFFKSNFVNINVKNSLPLFLLFRCISFGQAAPWSLFFVWFKLCGQFLDHTIHWEKCVDVCVPTRLQPCACTCCSDRALPWLGSPWQFLSLTSDVWAGRSWAHTHRTSAWDKQTGPPVLAFVQVTRAAKHASTCAQTHTTIPSCTNTHLGTRVLDHC